MDYNENYIEISYNAEELNELFLKEFISFRKENNLTQDLMAKYSNVTREKIARIECGYSNPSILSILKILAPLGYTIKISKVKNN